MTSGKQKAAALARRSLFFVWEEESIAATVAEVSNEFDYSHHDFPIIFTARDWQKLTN